MKDDQFNTLLQLIAQQGKRIEVLSEEMRQEFAKVREEMRQEFANVRKEIHRGFLDQAELSNAILAHIDERVPA